MPSALVGADAAAGGLSLTVAVAVVDADAAAVAVVDGHRPTVISWPSDILLQCGLTLEYRLQQIRDASPHDFFEKLGGIEAVAASLKSFLRLLDEDEKTLSMTAISMPAAKVIIAPH